MKNLTQKKEDLSLLKMRLIDLSDEINMKIGLAKRLSEDIHLLKEDINRDEAIP